MKKFLLTLLLSSFSLFGVVELGVDVFFQDQYFNSLKGNRIGLITNHTGVNKNLQSTVELFKQKGMPFTFSAIFCPEHGLNGVAYAWEKVSHSAEVSGIPVYSLHGKTRRPTSKMLEGIDVLIYDIQDVGVRCYTYATTLYYAMEEAAKRGIQVIVLDRPNPMTGEVIDGVMLEDKWRSYVGYVNVPFCHGMTIGELAEFFNQEYHIKCDLKVIPMKGWTRGMSFQDTGLSWIPTSPHIPEADTPLYYATTGIIGELGLVNMGVGYSMPFKLIGAQWINANLLAEKLNAQKLPGVVFTPFHYRPFYGSFRAKNLHGVLIRITNPRTYKPCSVQFAILGILKSLYPSQVEPALKSIKPLQKTGFCKAMGTDEVFSILTNEKYVVWKLIGYQKIEREKFALKRQKYLLY